MKSDVFTWLDSNRAKFKNKSDAAEAIAGKVVPIKYRTAYDWIGAWEKLRSAGTP